jgi:hypothetical protein
MKIREYYRVGALSPDKRRLLVTDFSRQEDAEQFVIDSYNDEWRVTIHVVREAA